MKEYVAMHIQVKYTWGWDYALAIQRFVQLHLNVWQPSWWRHQMEAFSALLAICAGNSPVPGEYPAQRPVTRSFAIFFDLRLNKRLSKQSWGWWFETLPHPLWRNVMMLYRAIVLTPICLYVILFLSLYHFSYSCHIDILLSKLISAIVQCFILNGRV